VGTILPSQRNALHG